MEAREPATPKMGRKVRLRSGKKRSGKRNTRAVNRNVGVGEGSDEVSGRANSWETTAL